MSQPGATPRHRHRRKNASPGRARGPLLAITAVLVLIAPIAWIVFQEPDSEKSDASVRYVTRDDDRYLTPTNSPVPVRDSPTTSPADSESPTPGRTTPAPTPSASPTPGHATSTSAATDLPTDDHTDEPTSDPTDGPTDGPSADGPLVEPTRAESTREPASVPTTDKPQPTKTSTSPPPSPDGNLDDGDMDDEERRLFTLIDNARTDNGCTPLRRNSSLSESAGEDAEDRAESGQMSGGGSSSMATAGGDDWSARRAFNQMMAQSSGTILNCSLDELGVGRYSHPYCKIVWCPGDFGMTDRVAWVAEFR